jgi:hypothetical protein
MGTGVPKRLTLARPANRRIRFESGALRITRGVAGRVWGDLPWYPQAECQSLAGWFPASPDSTRFRRVLSFLRAR